ncbi:MAG: hypothetical protein MJB14_22760 [Spirochaetes bacterium]|nr:hypothetical protein [Spirochaetota bacterium]
MIKKNSFFMFFILFFFVTQYNFGEIPIIFVSSEQESLNKEIPSLCSEILNYFPLSLYYTKFKFHFYYDQELQITVNHYQQIDYPYQFVLDLIEKKLNNPELTIFLLKEDVFLAKGGNIGKQHHPVVFVSQQAGAGILLHEIMHALFDLGDEYGNRPLFKPTESEVSRYPNLTTVPDQPLWEKIKQEMKDPLLNYYAGGLGTSWGVYHSYPHCIMNQAQGELCLVCCYYVLKKLNQLTGLDWQLPEAYLYQKEQTNYQPKINIIE